MAARKRRNASRKPAASTGRLLLVLLLAVILVAGYLAYVAWERERASRRPAPIEETTDLVSDDRILFAGAPRPRDPADLRLATTILRRHAYIAGYSETRREPLWVAYRVIHMDTPFKLPRFAGFITDPDLSAPVKTADYTNSGFDRGHMAPNAAIAECYGREAQRETYFMSNICPQSPALNEKVWVILETAERRYAGKEEEVWVVTGPIFADMNGGTTTKLASGVAVPSSFYKIVVDEEGRRGGKVREFAVVMPQDVKGTELPQEFLSSVDDIETRTGLDFLWKLDDATEAELESAKSRMW